MMVLFIFLLSFLINLGAIAAHYIPIRYIGLGLMVIEPIFYFFFTYIILWKKKLAERQSCIILLSILLGRIILEFPMRIIDSEYIYRLVNNNIYITETLACIMLILTAYFLYSRKLFFSLLMVSILLMITLSPLRAIPSTFINFSLLIEPVAYFLFTYIILIKKKLTGNMAYIGTAAILLGSIILYILTGIQAIGYISKGVLMTSACNILFILAAYLLYKYKVKAITAIVIAVIVWLYFLYF